MPYTDWAQILAAAGVADSPGREEAIEQALEVTARKRRSAGLPKRSSKSRSRPAHFPSLKHSTQES